MKKSLVLFAALSFVFISCTKGDFKKEDKTNWKKDVCEVCEDDSFQDPTLVASTYKKYEIKELKYNAYGCIESGYLKYLKDGETVALVKYWTKDNITEGWKQICFDGSCDNKETTECYFELTCER